MEENERNEGGISIGDIFRTIFSQKWLALIIAAVIFIGGTVALYFLNKQKDTYSVTFVLHLPANGNDSTTSYTYPDGESFYFTDIISFKNLKAVSDDEKYETVDVDNLVKEGDITIARALDEVTSESSNLEVYDLVYKISVKAKYFSSEESASAFIVALTEIPGEHISNMNINYDRNLTSSKSALTYELQLDALKNQMLYIQSKYATFVSAYGNEFLLNDGTALVTYKSKVDKYLNEDIFTTLQTEAKKNSYIKGTSASADERAKYESDWYSKSLELEVEKNALNAYIKRLQNSGSTIISDEQIYNHELKIATIEQEMEILQKYIDSFDASGKVANAEYEAKIAKVESEVQKFTDEISPIASYLYRKVTNVNYLDSGIIEVTKGGSLVQSAIMSLAAGVVLALIVAYIVGYIKNNKNKTVQATAPVYTEAQLQIALTDESEDKKDEN